MERHTIPKPLNGTVKNFDVNGATPLRQPIYAFKKKKTTTFIYIYLKF
jgi:hypothetical protein